MHPEVDKQIYSLSLRESEERYRALANATSEGILMHRNGIIIEANDEIARIIGYPLESLVGKNILSLVSTDARSTLAAHFNIDTKRRSYEVTGVRPDGARYYVEVRSNEITFQNRATRVATIRDITERKKIEESLRRSEQELRSILQNMQDTFYRTDGEGRIILASPSCYQLLHYTVEELLGTLLADLYVYPEDRKQLLELLASNNGKVTQHRTYLKRKDGKKIWVSTNAQYYYDRQGKVAGVEGTTRDITEMIETEEKLQEALKEAEAASHAKGEFLAMMSHEIRTPMNGVLTTAQLLETTPLNSEQRRYVETINSSGKLLYTLLNDVLDLSKLEAGKLQLENDDFEFNQMLANVVTLVEPLARGKGLDFRINKDKEGPLCLRGDQVRLQQILLNLLSNAVKFTERGFVVLSVATIPQGDQCLLELAVEDSGIGIPASDQQRLFQPFEQRDASITRRFGGTGLGLAITRELVTLMGGTIGVTSKEQGGSRFSLTLSFAKGTKNPAHEESELTLGAAYTFLLVDDDPVNRGAMGALLERDGHKVTLAQDGQHALDILRDSRFDYLLIDIHMPGIDGIETVRRWKSSDPVQSARTHIVALTADTRRETVARCKEEGIQSLLPKPLIKRDLYKLIRSHAGAVREEESSYVKESTEALVDETYISQLVGDIGIESLAPHIELFQRTGIEARDNLANAWDLGDLSGVKFWAHRLAGSSRMVGLATLADSCNRIEGLIRDGAPPEHIQDAIAEFRQLYTQSAESLGGWLRKMRRKAGIGAF